MSRIEKTTFTCPKCRKESAFTIWHSVNTTLNPEMKERIIDGSAFVHVCPSCGYKTRTLWNMLYHDMANQIMIQLYPKENNLRLGDNGIKMLEMMKGRYLVRMVESAEELQEKIHIFDESLDDRIVELSKLITFIKMGEEHPDIKVEKIIFHRNLKDKQDAFQVIANGKTAAVNMCPFSSYDYFYNESIKKLPGIREDDLVIDQEWAMKWLSQAR